MGEAMIQGVVKVSTEFVLPRRCGCVEYYGEMGVWHRNPLRRLQFAIVRRIQDRSLRSNDQTNARPYRIVACREHRWDPWHAWRAARDAVAEQKRREELLRSMGRG